jgi:hypothetical protein
VAGDVELPPFRFSYFDPADKQYKTAESARLRLQVTPGKPGAPPSPGEETAAVSAVGKDLRYIKPDRNQLDDRGGWMLASPLFVALNLMPPLMIAAAFLLRRRQDQLSTDAALARKLRAGKKVKRALAQARKAETGGDALSAFAFSYKALAGYISDQFNRPEAGMTTAEAAATLRAGKVPEDLIQEVEAVLSECDRARFAPAAVQAQGASGIVARAEGLIRRLAKGGGK